jgi:hypothetical protein
LFQLLEKGVIVTYSIRSVPTGQLLGSGIRHPSIRPARRAPAGETLSPAEIVNRLEEAGAALLAMPSTGYSTRMRQMRFDIVHTALEAYGWEAPGLRAPAPDAAAISAMDEAFGWLALIPESQFLLRRILGARALVHPLTGRHLFTWRRLAASVGADHKSVQRWHGQAVAIVARGLAGGVTVLR